MRGLVFSTFSKDSLLINNLVTINFLPQRIKMSDKKRRGIMPEMKKYTRRKQKEIDHNNKI